MQGFASCMLNPALVALTLNLVTTAAVAERLGRNARYAAIGSACGAVLMGACGTFVSSRAVFWLAALLCVPALLALRSLGGRPGARPPARLTKSPMREPVWKVLLDRRLLAYLACVMLFHLSNAAMLPLAGVEITKRADHEAEPDHRCLHPGAAVDHGRIVRPARGVGRATMGQEGRASWPGSAALRRRGRCCWRSWTIRCGSCRCRRSMVSVERRSA